MLLLRVGLFLLVYMASLIALAKFCSSLPTMLKLSSMAEWSVVDWWPYMGESALRCAP